MMLATSHPTSIVQAAADARHADTAWQSELCRVYGRSAPEARYDRRGYATPELARLREHKLTADRAFDEAWKGME